MKMKRITFDGNFCDISQCREMPCPYPTGCSQKQVWERLKEYEDTGLTPEQIKQQYGFTVKVIAQRWGVSADRLRELAQADKDGRCVVLPCKVGDTVYRIKRIDGYECGGLVYKREEVEKTIFSLCYIDDFGKTVFLTRETAEAALKGEE